MVALSLKMGVFRLVCHALFFVSGYKTVLFLCDGFAFLIAVSSASFFLD